MVRQAVVAGLASSGCRVSDLGVVPTPTVQLLVRQLGAQGGIADHRQPQPAGVERAQVRRGRRALPERARAAASSSTSTTRATTPRRRASTSARPSAWRTRWSATCARCSTASAALPAGRRLRVVVDPRRGRGARSRPRACVEALGAEVDGDPHHR
ncbi:MAG: hypothetical protein M0C28_36955 [Candidatus Moduliflexus flocculans]|nr:hypothetical protein [Candidatus Moduliflexus flocculans]